MIDLIKIYFSCLDNYFPLAKFAFVGDEPGYDPN